MSQSENIRSYQYIEGHYLRPPKTLFLKQCYISSTHGAFLNQSNLEPYAFLKEYMKYDHMGNQQAQIIVLYRTACLKCTKVYFMLPPSKVQAQYTSFQHLLRFRVFRRNCLIPILGICVWNLGTRINPQTQWALMLIRRTRTKVSTL